MMFSLAIRSQLRRVACYRKSTVAYTLRFSSSSSSNFHYVSDYRNLIDKINQERANVKSQESQEKFIIDALKSCRQFQSVTNEKPSEKSASVIETKHVIDELFKDETWAFSPELLKQIFLLKLPTPINLHLINIYYRQNPGSSTIIPKETALIALRNSLFNGEFQSAIKLTDVTVGHPNYILKNQQILRSGIMRLIGTTVAITALNKVGISEIVDMGGLSDGWKHLSSINSMILTYIFNSTFFMTIVRLGRQSVSAGGDYVTWQKGTFYNNWFKHSDEMMFASRIIEADRSLNGGQSTPEIVDELCRVNEDLYTDQHTLQPGYNRDGQKIRLLQTRDDLEDLKLQAYWMSGGDGFEWVEPDQDPADIIWKQHLDVYNKPSLENNSKRGLKWADDLILPENVNSEK